MVGFSDKNFNIMLNKLVLIKFHVSFFFFLIFYVGGLLWGNILRSVYYETIFYLIGLIKSVNQLDSEPHKLMTQIY